jgi:UDP-N-acetylmuramoyl-tripeptide--D-alanyl-D-alanine ligase
VQTLKVVVASMANTVQAQALTEPKPVMMTVAALARALGAKLVLPISESVRDGFFTGVSTDTRSIAAGELFVALMGENFNGNTYVEKAAALGAVAALVSEVQENASIAQVVVPNTRTALGLLAQLWRSRFSIPKIALTGSNGKTTVKEMLRAIFIAHYESADYVHATEGNLNNDIGLPLTLCKLRGHHRVSVLEMGMNHLGEINYLTRLAQPDVALINMAGTAHIGELGSVEAIAQAKGEILSGLTDHGVAVLNADDRFYSYWQKGAGARRIVSFGLRNSAADVNGVIALHGLEINYQGSNAVTQLQVVGEHNMRNALAAAAAALVIGVPLSSVANGLSAFVGVAGRLRNFEAICGGRVIDDSYNANADSMQAAIKVLAATPANMRILVLGDMGEQGAKTVEMHRLVGAAARAAGIENLFLLGSASVETAHGYGNGAKHFQTVESLVAAMQPLLSPQTTVLVKGSRFMAMERVVAALVADKNYLNKAAH